MVLENLLFLAKNLARLGLVYKAMKMDAINKQLIELHDKRTVTENNYEVIFDHFRNNVKMSLQLSISEVLPSRNLTRKLIFLTSTS